jgi:hypothetical protein
MTSFRTAFVGLSLAIGIAASAMAQPSAPWDSRTPPSEPTAPLPDTSAAAEPDAPPETGPSPQAQPVIDVQQVQNITRQFQTELNRLGGIAQITHCGPVLRLLTPQTGGYDESRGAVCDLQVADKRAPAVMCDDRRGAKFTLTLATIRDLDSVRRFIANNCFPEG